MTLTAAKSWELININCIDYWQNSCVYKLESEAADCEEYLSAISPRAPISILSVFIFHVGAATNNWNNNTHFLTAAEHRFTSAVKLRSRNMEMSLLQKTEWKVVFKCNCDVCNDLFKIDLKCVKKQKN